MPKPTHMTRVEFVWDDSGRAHPLTIEAIQGVAAIWLATHTTSKFAFKDIETVVDEPFSYGFNHLGSDEIIALAGEVARHFPDVKFYVRGVGDQFNNMWLREFVNGEVSFSAGPFDRDVPPQKGGWLSKLFGE